MALSSSYAGACAQATADAIAEFNAMKASCGCDLSTYTKASAWASVYEELFAYAESQVTAQACSDEYDGTATEAEIRRTCLVHSVAAASAKVRHCCFIVIKSMRTCQPPCHAVLLLEASRGGWHFESDRWVLNILA